MCLCSNLGITSQMVKATQESIQNTKEFDIRSDPPSDVPKEASKVINPRRSLEEGISGQ
ncbi:hypothetical protein HanIR_Chr06g0287041 [Helianthus annuus]|nr:hypothetical protein HanIR_Chr06g0287041 [Helianthus annuus]